MKKLSLAVCILLSLTLLFSFTACSEVENGVKIKYATVTFQIGEDTTNTKDLTFKLYNYQFPGVGSAVEYVEKAADNGFYTGSVINTVETSWLTFGGYVLGDNGYNVNAMEATQGIFYANGFSGNTQSITNGTLIMYRDFNNKFNNATAYNSATGALAICTSASAPFTSSEYCILGNVIAEDLDTLEDLAELRNSSDDEDETVFNYYYVGGLEEMFGTNDKHLIDADFEAEEIEDIKEYAERFAKASTLGIEATGVTKDIEDFAEFRTLATKLISYTGGNIAEYFFTLPKEDVKVVGFTFTNKLK